MEIVYAREEPPTSFSKTLFLAGPTPRSKDVASWRPEALQILKKLKYNGVVFVPEPRDGQWSPDYLGQVEWEEKCLHLADGILFWLPRELKDMPGFTTNTEWGVWQSSGKVVFGAPAWAAKVNYQQYYVMKLGVPTATTLEETMQLAIELIGEGVIRRGGEREVPLYIWRTPHFQQWYKAQRQAGNRLDGARVEWSFRIHQKKFPVFWVLHVNVYIASENRHKINEVVIGRPDIATIVMYRPSKILDDTDIVLIREFRSAAATEDGFVWENPGGSSFKPNSNHLEVAAKECEEETGLKIYPSRIKCHESRQMVATFASHKAHLFSMEITNEELTFLRAQYGVPHGVVADTERTYVEIRKLREIRESTNVDWSMLGMILAVLTK